MQQEQMPSGPMELMVRGGEQKEDTHQIMTQISGNANRAKGSEAEMCGRMGRGGGEVGRNGCWALAKVKEGLPELRSEARAGGNRAREGGKLDPLGTAV